MIKYQLTISFRRTEKYMVLVYGIYKQMNKTLQNPLASRLVHGISKSSENIWQFPKISQRVLSTHVGYTYPNHKGSYYYRNHTLYHIGTLDPLGRGPQFGPQYITVVIIGPQNDTPNFRKPPFGWAPPRTPGLHFEMSTATLSA